MFQLSCVSDVVSRLESRQKVAPQVFADTMKLREESHHLGESAGPGVIALASFVQWRPVPYNDD